MSKPEVFVLKALRKIHKDVFPDHTLPKISVDKDPDSASATIYEQLMNDGPSMIARFGSTELQCVCNYLGVASGKRNYVSFIRGTSNPWWWEPAYIDQLGQNSGFFPKEIDFAEKFCRLIIDCVPKVDVLGSWLKQERFFDEELKNCKKVDLELLNPFFSKKPWTMALEGKRILVVHPFAQTIERQYKKRDLIFPNGLLPTFDLQTIQAVQGVADQKTGFNTWFDAFEYMKSEIDKRDFDICLIGCGAYGFPLAAHVKDIGKKAFHIGGSLQLLFGIKGKRWENPNYNKVYNYSRVMNEYWVKPSITDVPSNADKVEEGCYW